MGSTTNRVPIAVFRPLKNNRENSFDLEFYLSRNNTVQKNVHIIWHQWG